MKNQLLSLSIDSESVHIYRDNGEFIDPTTVVYWHEEELFEGETLWNKVSELIELFHTDQRRLLNMFKLDHLILTKYSPIILARKAFQSEMGMQLDELYMTTDGNAFVHEHEADKHHKENRDKCNAAIFLFQRHEVIIDGVFIEGDIVYLRGNDTRMEIVWLHGKTAYCTYVTPNEDNTEYSDAFMEVSINDLEHFRQ